MMCGVIMADKPKRSEARLTHTDIERILGAVEDEQAVALSATGASPAELETAAVLAQGETDVLSSARVKPSPRIAALYDILTARAFEAEGPD